MDSPTNSTEPEVLTHVEFSRRGGHARKKALSKRRISEISAHASRIRWKRWRKTQKLAPMQVTESV